MRVRAVTADNENVNTPAETEDRKNERVDIYRHEEDVFVRNFKITCLVIQRHPVDPNLCVIQSSHHTSFVLIFDITNSIIEGPFGFAILPPLFRHQSRVSGECASIFLTSIPMMH